MIDEDAVMSSTMGFICRKCVRALEGFQTATAMLLQSAEAALRYMPSMKVNKKSINKWVQD